MRKSLKVGVVRPKFGFLKGFVVVVRKECKGFGGGKCETVIVVADYAGILIDVVGFALFFEMRV